jgi:hypothetical protein
MLERRRGNTSIQMAHNQVYIFVVVSEDNYGGARHGALKIFSSESKAKEYASTLDTPSTMVIPFAIEIESRVGKCRGMCRGNTDENF